MTTENFVVRARGQGLPDYSAPAPVGQAAKPTLYTLSDMAELAARLGSIDTYDRRGDVIYLDPFEQNLEKWEITAPGGVGSIGLSTVTARNGSQSARLVTDAVAGARATISKLLPVPILGRIGFEASYVLTAGTRYIFHGIVYRDGTNQRVFNIAYIPGTGLQVLDSNGNYQYFDSTVRLVTDTKLFNVLKLVVNLVTGQYERILYNENFFDLSAFSGQQTVSALYARMAFPMEVAADAAASATMYAGHAIMTQNEPQNV